MFWKTELIFTRLHQYLYDFYLLIQIAFLIIANNKISISKIEYPDKLIKKLSEYIHVLKIDTKSYTKISKYIHTQKIDQNECPNKSLHEK